MTFVHFPRPLNPHYNFSDPRNREVIAATEAYDRAFLSEPRDIAYLEAAERAALGGRTTYETGVCVEAPWGENLIVSFQKATNGEPDRCVKKITVNPGYMLSLQRHRGRSENWKVLDGTLTVIRNGNRIDVQAGESIDLDIGDIHCMSNASFRPVTVRETQTGTCREADNVRLCDANNRPIYPLTNPTEYESARAYAALQLEINGLHGTGYNPHPGLLRKV